MATETMRPRFAAALLLVGGLAWPAPLWADSFTGNYLAARHAAANDMSKEAAEHFTRALALAGDKYGRDERLLEQTIHHKLQSADIPGAAKLARKLVELSPGNRMAQLTIIIDDIAQKRFADAQSRLLEAEGLAINMLLETLLLGWSTWGKGDHVAAAQHLDQLKGRPVFEIFGKYHQALMQSAAGNEKAAIETFAQVMKMTRTPTPRIAEAYGRVLERAGKRSEAEALYRLVLEKSGDDPAITAGLNRVLAGGKKPTLAVRDAREGVAEALYGMAGALAQERDSSLAMLHLRMALHLRNDFPDAQLLLAEVLESRGRWTEAEATYRGIGPDTALYRSAQIGLASTLSRLDKVDDAIKVLMQLAKRLPEDMGVRVAHADLLWRHEKFAEAEAAYGDIVEGLKTPEERHWRLFYNRAVAAERSGQWPIAEENFERALQLSPDQPLALNYLGYSLVEKGLRLAEARKMLERAVELRPNDGFIVDSLGWALFKMGEYEEAVLKLERAIELSPEEAVINDHYGDALWVVGRKIEAAFQWKRALSLKSKDINPERIKRKLAEGLDAVLQAEGVTLPKPVSSTPANKAEAPAPGTKAGGG